MKVYEDVVGLKVSFNFLMEMCKEYFLKINGLEVFLYNLGWKLLSSLYWLVIIENFEFLDL